MAEKVADVCFEVSWEVCNKVGGIYTVVKSKAQQMKRFYGDDYFLVGPYFPKKAFGIFEELVPPDDLKVLFESLNQKGIEVHFGKWFAKGDPFVMLIDFANFTKNTNEIKRRLWEWYKIDSLNTDYFDFSEPIVWSYAVGVLIHEFSKIVNKRIVAHFHEWLTAGGLLYLRHNDIKVGTVFTTHATSLGRSISNTGVSLYDVIDKVDPDAEAKKFGSSLFAKHLTEKACANAAHVFTTVSEITGLEAEKLLGRKPDVLLFNGLDMANFPSFEEASVRHVLFRNRIKNFLLYYFFSYYTFDLDNTLIFFIAGRYEFHDKGIDVLIEALEKLNQKLKDENCSKTIVCFFFIPGNVRSIRPVLLENKTLFKDVSDSLDDVSDDVKSRLLYLLVSRKEMKKESIFDPGFIREITPKIRRFKRQGWPPLSTHVLFDEDNDLILNALKNSGLDNSPDDKVKVVYYPIYLTGADGLLDTSYYESMIGGHLGIFPSCYEPWGYTPLEAAALGVSSITTDSAGFGRFIKDKVSEKTFPGVFVLNNFKVSRDAIVDGLHEFLYSFAHLSKRDRVENKIAAQRVAHLADWRIFVNNYIDAHDLAVKRI
ncbi:hypothetical protein DRJ25_02430 [Candidatus Woesearchaeota archaeon]|nr:MAG: hypothetical protein DRJ25_02430 [Candidatus Woesearchaeota archaeon]